MLQVRSSLDVADNTGAKVAWNIGVLGRNQTFAGIGDVIKVHIKDAAPDGQVKKGEVHDAVIVRTRQTIRRSESSLSGRSPGTRSARLRSKSGAYAGVPRSSQSSRSHGRFHANSTEGTLRS